MNREERLYSVTMTADELRLFSEFLEQKEYAIAPKMPKKKPMIHPSVRNAKKIEKGARRGVNRLTPSRADLDMRDAAGLNSPWD